MRRSAGALVATLPRISWHHAVFVMHDAGLDMCHDRPGHFADFGQAEFLVGRSGLAQCPFVNAVAPTAMGRPPSMFAAVRAYLVGGDSPHVRLDMAC